MLEKTGAAQTFLAFGKDRRVLKKRLRRYGRLVNHIAFYFNSKKEGFTVELVSSENLSPS
jgi:hypothetical protein